MKPEIHFLPFATLPAVKRNDAIVNLVIAGPKQGTNNIKTGITRLAPGAVVPRHTHNAEEQVTVLEGKLRMVLGEQSFDCTRYDSTYISAGVPHEFTNIGDEEALVLVIYGTSRVTRTFTDTGETVDLGSERDTFPPLPPAGATAAAAAAAPADRP